MRLITTLLPGGVGTGEGSEGQTGGRGEARFGPIAR